MGWAAGWSKRIQLTIDNTKIDDTLNDFPVMIHLNDTTASGVFDELGASSKKLAVYTSDHRPCYVEIERWDDSNRLAWLWAKLPAVSSGTNTSFYLYYDSSHEDNTSYVGTVTSTAAKNVWDDNFEAVYHMGQDPSGGASSIKDSTTNVHHGTPYGTMISNDLVDGKIGKALDFDGADDYIEIYNSGELIAQDTITVSAIVKRASLGSQAIFVQNDTTGAYVTHHFRLTTGGIYYDNYLPSGGGNYGSGADDTTNYYHITVTRDSNLVTLYVNGQFTASGTGEPRTSAGDIDNVLLGARYYAAAAQEPYQGIMEEVRVSDYARSSAWVKAEYHSSFDTLLTYGAEQTSTPGALPFENRLILTISHTNIDSDLSDFPVLIKLSNSSGLTSFDGTLVFDELASDANRKKIAVTTEDGVSQCFVEIEKWSDSSEEAWLWVKVPSVSASSDTALYLYYDSTAAENTDFVGDVTSYPGQQVWTNGFYQVYHLSDTSAPLLDSTTTNATAPPAGSYALATPAKIAEGIDWTGQGGAVDYFSEFSPSQITVEVWIKEGSVDSSIHRWVSCAGSSGDMAVIRQDSGTAEFHFYIQTASTLRHIRVASAIDTNWAYWAGTWDGTTQRAYKDGSQIGTPNVPGGSLEPIANISINSNSSEYFTGLQDEVRVSTTSRNASWLKATYYTCNDNLLYMEEDVTEADWLGSWGQRIKLTIDKDKVDENVIDFPVLVKVSDSSGITSADLTAFFNELTLSSGVYNKSDYEDDFTGTNGDPPNTDKWTEIDSTNSMDIQSNKLHFDGEGSGNKTSYVVSTFMFDGNSAFDIQVDFDLLTWTTPSSNDNYVRLGISTGPVYTWMARQQGTGGATNRMRLYGNGGTNHSAWNWTGTTGKFRFTWDGTSVLKAYVWTGSQWEWQGNISGYTCSENYAGDEIGVNLLFEQEATGGDVEATFDNFTINSGHVIYDVNRKKVACTTADGTTQCYAEIEEFDVVDEEVFYWVKVPVISSTEDTILYLYYDSSQSDNTDYIGDFGGVPAQRVWDENFVMVYHMNQNPAVGLEDSSGNPVVDTTASTNFESSDLVDGLAGKAVSGDGIDEKFNLPTTGALEVSPFTIEVILQKNTQAASAAIISYLPKNAHSVGLGWIVGVNSGGIVYTNKGSNDGSWEGTGSISAIDDGEYHHIASRFEADTLYDLVIDGTIEDSETAPNLADVVYTDGAGSFPPSKQSRIFDQVDSSGNEYRFVDGKIDEIRISNIVRSLSWVKATNYTAKDNLISYGAPEPEPAPSVGTFNGYVELAGQSVARIVALYRRSTGELQDYTTSNPNTGYFELETPYDELHYLVILPDIDDGYQPMARDQIDPV